VKECAEGLEKRAVPGHTQQVPPGPPIGRAMGAEIAPSPQPRSAQSELGQKCVAGSTSRRRPRVMTMRGGAAEGACT
jgi:hypothetical protein